MFRAKGWKAYAPGMCRRRLAQAVLCACAGWTRGASRATRIRPVERSYRARRRHRDRIWEHAELFGAIANLFDRKYETFGAFSPTGEVPLSQAPGATNPRSLSPAPPRMLEGGVRLTP